MNVDKEYKENRSLYDKKVVYILPKNMLIKATQKQYMIKIGIFLINK
jgi:hypothetical protein